MDKEKEIEELKQILFNNTMARYDICGECSLRKCDKNNKPDCSKYLDIAKVIVEAGYGDIKQYQNEIDCLQTELSHREEDLVHADEKVFYREMTVKLEEDKIKQQAVREFAAGLEEIRHSVRGLNVCFDDEWRYLLEDVLIKIDELLAEVTGK